MKVIGIDHDSFGYRGTNKAIHLSRISYVVLCLASIAGLVLSVMSALNICNSACSDASQYAIFGLNFGWFGVLYFTLLLTILALQRRFTWAGHILDLFIFAAAGAELRFVWLQKYVIGRWCPLCLSIAAIIYLMAIVALLNRKSMLLSRRNTMKEYVKQITVMLLALATGLTGAILGIKKEAGAAELNMFLGKSDSPTIVYFVSDWFCPACRRTEPAIAKMYPKIAEIAKVAFVDIPVHPETTNFTPYNTQFLVYEKAKYIQLRGALAELARRTKNPSPDDVQKAIAPYGVKLRTMNFVDIEAGMEWNKEINMTYEINATPTVVIANEKSGKHIKLVGEKEINYQAVLKAISDVRK